ncbi:cytochrome P450 [Streptomyces lunalinharesii]
MSGPWVDQRTPQLVEFIDRYLDEHPIPRRWAVLPTLYDLTSALATFLCLGLACPMWQEIAASLRQATPGAVATDRAGLRQGRRLREFDVQAQRVTDALHQLLQRRRTQPNSTKGSVLDLLAHGGEPDGQPSGWSDEARVETLWFMLYTAQTAPAMATSWLLYLLAHHPEVQQGLRHEAHQPASQTAASHLIRTREAGSESLRLYPPTWLLGRTVRQDTKIDGHLVQPGDQVRVAVQLIQRDERFFPDPHRFHPARWEPGGPAGQAPRGAYLPFGLGTHFCRGTAWVHALTGLTVAALLRRYEFTTPRRPQVRPRLAGHLEPTHLTLLCSRTS